MTLEEYRRYEAPLGRRDELVNGEVILSPGPGRPRHHDQAGENGSVWAGQEIVLPARLGAGSIRFSVE